MAFKLFIFQAFMSFLHNECKHVDTGAPRNSRTFYLRIRFFTIEENIPKFIICDFDSASLAYVRFLNWFYNQKTTKLVEN